MCVIDMLRKDMLTNGLSGCVPAEACLRPRACDCCSTADKFKSGLHCGKGKAKISWFCTIFFGTKVKRICIIVINTKKSHLDGTTNLDLYATEMMKVC